MNKLLIDINKLADLKILNPLLELESLDEQSKAINDLIEFLSESTQVALVPAMHQRNKDGEWIAVDSEDVAHYKSKGQEVRELVALIDANTKEPFELETNKVAPLRIGTIDTRFSGNICWEHGLLRCHLTNGMPVYATAEPDCKAPNAIHFLNRLLQELDSNEKLAASGMNISHNDARLDAEQYVNSNRDILDGLKDRTPKMHGALSRSMMNTTRAFRNCKTGDITYTQNNAVDPEDIEEVLIIPSVSNAAIDMAIGSLDYDPADAIPESWRAFILECSGHAGRMINGNRQSIKAKGLLDEVNNKSRNLTTGD